MDIPIFEEIIKDIDYNIADGYDISESIVLAIVNYNISFEQFYNICDQHLCCTRHCQRICYSDQEQINNINQCYKNICYCNKNCMTCLCPCRNYARILVNDIKKITGVDIRSE
jgi:hypothetical protein